MSRTIEITKIRRFSGEISVPGDKSISHRALLLAAIAPGTSRVNGLATGLDILATRQAIQRLGAVVTRISETELDIEGREGSGNLQEPDEPINCLNSGTSVRLLSGLVAGAPFLSVLTGDRSLRSRPMLRIVEPLRRMGASIMGRQEGNCLPLCIHGEKSLTPTDFRLSVASAQVKSAILLAGLSANGETSVTEPFQTRDHTENMLEAAGISIKRTGFMVSLSGPSHPIPINWKIPGDASAAAFFVVGAAIHPGSSLIVRDVSLNPTRTAFLEVLRMMGAEIEVLERAVVFGEPVGTIRVNGCRLKGISIGRERVSLIIDELPILAVAMALAEGTSLVEGAEELRRKESDRIQSLVCEFRKFGLGADEHPGGFSIAGLGRPIAPPFSDAHGDHRIGMSLAILGTAAEGTTIIREAQWIDVSFPGFEALLRRVSI